MVNGASKMLQAHCQGGEAADRLAQAPANRNEKVINLFIRQRKRCLERMLRMRLAWWTGLTSHPVHPGLDSTLCRTRGWKFVVQTKLA